MPNVIAKAVMTKDGQFRSIIIAYYPELEAQVKNTADALKPSPYRALMYSNSTITNEWEYDYEGRSANRFYVEIGKAVADNWQITDVQKNFTETTE